MMDDVLLNRLEEKKKIKTYRELSLSTSSVDFSSNDYLGIAKLPGKEGLPSGSTGSRLLSGNSSLAEEAEDLLANSFGYEKTLIYSSGYLANLGVLSCLPQRGDTILYDQYAHACIKDGARLSAATYHSFRHNDLADLERRLKNASGRSFIVVESIYSMDGDEAPLQAMADLADQYNASLIVDEAHATAVRGPHGGGLVEESGLQNRTLAVIYTFGKGMGSHGAAVAGSALLREYLINFSRPFIYTTALPPATYQHLIDVHPMISKYSDRRQALDLNIRYFLSQWEQEPHSPLTLLPSSSAIQAVVFPGNHAVHDLAFFLNKKSYDVRPILSPTVPAGTERLRICLHAYNNQEEISGLITALKSYVI
jgi:8-amino-7-oxononanoate synthase